MNSEQHYITYVVLFIMCIAYGTGKGYSVTFHWRHREWQKDGSAFSLTRRYVGVVGQRHAPAALPPGKKL
jgi:hypothetical protein